MYAGADFDPIDINEKPILTFDFGKYPLATGETLAAPVWTCAVVFGTDATPSARLIGSPTISGTQTLQQVGTMLAGVTYRFDAQVTTSLGQVLNLYSHVACQAPS